MNWPRAIIHVDMDTFFVSVERKNDPSLIGRPVIVGGGPGGEVRRGVVAACSYETRVFGVHSAMPLAEALRRCPQAIVVPVGRSDYGSATAEVRSLIEGFTDLFEMTSPDEAYVDLEGTDLLHGTPIQAADKLRCRISDGTGLPVSIGLATTRTHAKIASKLSKPQGLFAIPPGGEARIVRPLALRALPGLGPKTAARLERFGIATLGQLIEAGEKRLVDLVGDHGAGLYRRAIGKGTGKVSTSRERVQISSEQTYGEDIGDLARIHSNLGRMTMNVGASLRRKNRWAGTVTIKLRYPDFTTLTRQAPLTPPTDDDLVLIREAKRLFARAWDGKTPLRLLGVGVANLSEDRQEELFEVQGASKQKKLLEAVDKLRERDGKSALVWGAALKEKPTGGDPPASGG